MDLLMIKDTQLNGTVNALGKLAAYQKSQLPSKKIKHLKPDHPTILLRREIRRKREERSLNRPRAQLPIEFRLQYFKEKKAQAAFKEKILQHPNAKFWGKQDMALIEKELDFGREYSRHTARIKKANLKSVVAALKQKGFEIDHASKHHGLVSSYYMTKNGVRYRISDHDLPDTPERLSNRAEGFGGNWDEEVIIDADTPIEVIISDIMEI